MAPDLTMLRRAMDGFGGRLRAVHEEQWTLPTPCTEWTVRQLANHIVFGGTMTPMLLAGATAAEVTASRGDDVLDEDPVGVWERGSAAELTAFAEPGALARVVHHPGAGDIPATLLLGFRTSDYLLHTWDLARAIGADESLDPEAVAVAWSAMEPMAAMIPTVGVFGDGPSGLVGADAPLQARLLDLSGRRP